MQAWVDKDLESAAEQYCCIVFAGLSEGSPRQVEVHKVWKMRLKNHVA